MYHRLRGLHRWIGLISSLFLLVISVTGFLLATKSTFSWIRPPESKGAKVAALSEVISLEQAGEAAFTLGLAELAHMGHIDRIDYRPKSNIFKVLSKDGYHEVQVDGKSGKVLSHSFRRDQLSEDIHDLSYFSDSLHGYGLPFVAIGLFTLAASGIVIFFVPIARRALYRRKARLSTAVTKES
jgi:uncharacterized iron-regulated membrane protein